jgi:hypothetical protein
VPDNALYFPYINLPDTPWLRRLLLYWDAIEAIIPSELLEGSRVELSDGTRDLMSRGLLRPIDPRRLTTRPDYELFREAFIAELDRERDHESGADRSGPNDSVRDLLPGRVDTSGRLIS